LTVAVPVFVASATDVAVTVTAAGLGSVAGAVYRPVLSIVPLALPPLTAQVTVSLLELLTVAVNCWVWGGAPDKLGYSVLTDPGLTLTEMGGVDELPPPHATKKPESAKARHRPTILYRRDIFRPPRPSSTIPANGRLSGSHSRWF
jgi:hypothetical protein